MGLIHMSFLSKLLGMPTDINVIIPTYTREDSTEGTIRDPYVPGMKFQTLWLLHGGGGDYADYLKYTNIELYAEENKVAVVMPSGYNSAYGVEYARWSNDTEVMFRTLGANPWILGEFAWCTFDYLGEPFPHPYPNRSSCFALVDLAGLPKDRAYLYAAQWHTEGTPEVLHLLPHWSCQKNELIEVHAFTSCAAVELFLNGRSLGRRTREKNMPRLVWKDVAFEPGTLEAVGYDGDNQETARARRVTAGTPKAIGIRCEKEPCADGGAFVFAELFLTDGQGNGIETADEELTIKVDGGTLIGVDNGDARCLLPFKRSTIRLYNGHAMVTAWFAAGGALSVTGGGLSASCNI